MKIQLKPYQDIFVFSQVRFPAMISSIGTGKTLCLLLKIWNYCEMYPNSLALIVRKEYTDLRDSTLKDFKTYFNVDVDANKEFKFANGSTIMFRHGGEIAVLKNMNLSIAGIEQGEEFDTDETFTFIRDRLRRQNGPYRQLCIIANANGHNWIHRLFISNATTVRILDEHTGQFIRERGEYLSVEANTWANEDVLPRDFIMDLKAMKTDAPNHYLQYVENSHEEVDADDLLFSHKDVYDAPKIVLSNQNRVDKRVMGLDVARFGNDETVFTIIEQKDIYRWEQVFLERQKKKDGPWITGYAMDLARKFNLDLMVVDDIGMGGMGVVDWLASAKYPVMGFIANHKTTSSKMDSYLDCNDEGFMMMEDLLKHSWLKLLPDIEQAEQLMNIRFTYKRMSGKDLVKHILGKEEMRLKYKELKSPDIAKALMMAVWGTDKRPLELEEHRHNLPKYSRMDNDLDYNQNNRDGDLPRYSRME